MKYINGGSVKPRNIASLHLLMTFEKKQECLQLLGILQILFYVWKITEKK